MTDTQSSLQGVRPHEKYYIDGGDLHIIAEDREFRVHRYFFDQDSAVFRDLLASPSGQPRKGSSHLTAIKLQGVTAKQFATFLWVFYNPTYSLYDTTEDDWKCILHLGRQWEFVEVEKLAIRELEKFPMSIVERIALYQEHKVSIETLIPHYATLVTRGSPLDFEESERLGMSTVVLINQAIYAIHSARNGDSSASSSVNAINAAVISKILAHVATGGTTAGPGLPGPSAATANATNGGPKRTSAFGANGKPGQFNGRN
ncbi:hypothetical protein C8F04DRAFT_1008821 [Mycena alexandri]|uniref:BTB domain-containing protein n=1 Tax=Mycena alexandri TaxID=1745969 RepID=A0AAD6SH39_9AGAR|nr:hypothetical protein C8F04DRAFT_1008821 [Mycena alexandri]